MSPGAESSHAVIPPRRAKTDFTQERQSPRPAHQQSLTFECAPEPLTNVANQGLKGCHRRSPPPLVTYTPVPVVLPDRTAVCGSKRGVRKERARGHHDGNDGEWPGRYDLRTFDRASYSVARVAGHAGRPGRSRLLGPIGMSDTEPGVRPASRPCVSEAGSAVSLVPSGSAIVVVAARRRRV